jgi:hypothetical protein
VPWLYSFQLEKQGLVHGFVGIGSLSYCVLRCHNSQSRFLKFSYSLDGVQASKSWILESRIKEIWPAKIDFHMIDCVGRKSITNSTVSAGVRDLTSRMQLYGNLCRWAQPCRPLLGANPCKISIFLLFSYFLYHLLEILFLVSINSPQRSIWHEINLLSHVDGTTMAPASQCKYVNP